MHGSTTGFFCRATVVDVASSPAPTIGQARTIRAPLSANKQEFFLRPNVLAHVRPCLSRPHRARCRPGEPHGPVRAARHVVSGRKPCRVTAAWCICTRRKPDWASACRCQGHVHLRGPVYGRDPTAPSGPGPVTSSPAANPAGSLLPGASAPVASRTRPLHVDAKLTYSCADPSRSKAANLTGSLRAGMPVPASAVDSIIASLAGLLRDVRAVSVHAAAAAAEPTTTRLLPEAHDAAKMVSVILFEQFPVPLTLDGAVKARFLEMAT